MFSIRTLCRLSRYVHPMTTNSLNRLLSGEWKSANVQSELQPSEIKALLLQACFMQRCQFVVVIETGDTGDTYNVQRIKMIRSPLYTFYLQISNDKCEFVEARDIAPFQQQQRGNWDKNDMRVSDLEDKLFYGLQNPENESKIEETHWFTDAHANAALHFLNAHPETAHLPYYVSIYTKICCHIQNINFVKGWKGDFISFLYSEPGVFSGTGIRGEKENVVKHVKLFDRIWSEYKTIDKEVKPIYGQFAEAYALHLAGNASVRQRMSTNNASRRIRAAKSKNAITPQRHSSSLLLERLRMLRMRLKQLYGADDSRTNDIDRYPWLSRTVLSPIAIVSLH